MSSGDGRRMREDRPIIREAHYLAYASGNLGKNLIWSTAEFTLLFMLTDMLGVDPAVAGLVFLAGLMVDAVADLGVGAAAQRAAHPLRLYGWFILLGAPLCAATFALLCSLPVLGVSSLAMITAAVLLFRATFALADVPHNALIAGSSRTRNRVAGYRFGFSTVAIALVAVAMPAITASPGRADALAGFCMAIAALMVAALWLSWFAVRGNGRQSAANRQTIGTRHMLASTNFRWLMLIALLTGLGPPLFAKGAVYYATYVLREPSASQAMLAGLVIGQLLSLPVWIWLSSRFEKGSILCATHMIAGVAILLFWLLAPGGTALLLVCSLVGAGLSGGYQPAALHQCDSAAVRQRRGGVRQQPRLDDDRPLCRAAAKRQLRPEDSWAGHAGPVLHRCRNLRLEERGVLGSVCAGSG